MRGPKPNITSWRAFVGGEQIGYRYPTQMDAHQAARIHIRENYDPNARPPSVVIRPSYSPIELSRRNQELDSDPKD